MPNLAFEGIIKRALKRADVLFCVCTHRNFHIDAAISVLNLIGKSKHQITFFPMKGDALIDRSRSRAASYFMQERNDDILFFVDDDENYSQDDVLKTIDNVMNGMDICGGMVMLKKPVTKIGNYIDKNLMFMSGQEVTFKKDAKPVQIRFIGSGFMAIHRRVFQKLIDETPKFPEYHPNNIPFCHPHDLKFWPFFQPFPWKNENDDHVYLSEDWAFCKKADNVGFKTWLDPSIFISHYGEYGWDLADALRQPKVRMDDNFSITLK